MKIGQNSPEMIKSNSSALAYTAVQCGTKVLYPVPMLGPISNDTIAEQNLVQNEWCQI